MYTRTWRYFHIMTDENGRTVRREIFLPAVDAADDGLSPLPSLPAPMTVEEGLRSDAEAVLGDAKRVISDFAAACERETKE